MTSPGMEVGGKRLFTWYSQNLRLYVSSLHAGIIGGEGETEVKSLEDLADFLESLVVEIRAITKRLKGRGILQ